MAVVAAAHPAARRVRRTAGRPGLTLDRFADKLLYFLLFLTLYRGTAMWYGYPTDQAFNESVSDLPMQVVLYSIVPPTLLYFLLRPREVIDRFRSMSIPTAVLLFAFLVSVLFSVNVASSVRGALAVAIITLPMMMFRWHYGLRRTIAAIQMFVAPAIAINLLYTLVFPRFGIMTGDLAGAWQGMFLHKNSFGQFAALSAVILFPSLRFAPKLDFSAMVKLAGFVLAVVAAVLAKSSTALVMMVIGIFGIALTGFVGMVGNRVQAALIAIGGVLVLIPAVLLFGDAGAQSAASELGKDLTFSGRTELWAVLWPHVFDYPLTGHGFLMFRTPGYLSQFADVLRWIPNSTHNTYLEILLNTGMIGGVLWLYVVVSRFFLKLTTPYRERADRVANGRQIAVMLLVMAGSATEAGRMLAPSIHWCFFAALLPFDAAPVAARAVVRRSHPRVRGEQPAAQAPAPVSAPAAEA